MSRYTITRAGDVRAGGADLPVSLPRVEVYEPTTGGSEIDSLLTAQVIAAGIVPLDGIYAGGNLPFTVPLIANTTNGASDNGLTLTVRGEDINGKPQHEVILFTGIPFAFAIKAFHRIHTVTASRASVGSITLGTVESGIGLKARSAGLSPFFMGFENDVLTAGTFTPGNQNAPAQNTIDQRCRFTPEDVTLTGYVFYIPDLTNLGLGENYVTPGEPDIDV